MPRTIPRGEHLGRPWGYPGRMDAMLAGTVLCAAACAALVAAEIAHADARRWIAKPLASLGFVIVASAALGRAQPALAALAWWIWIGQLAGAVGDLALLGSGTFRRKGAAHRARTWFAAGLAAFLLGHLAYAVGFATLVAPARWPSAAGWLAAAPLAIAAVVVRWLWPRLGALRVPVLAYIAVITAMLIAAIAVWHTGPVALAHRGRIAAGALLFFVSDLAVARDTFVAPGWINRAWGLPAYYAGQLVLAWSAV